MTTTYTDHFRFALPDFLSGPWHSDWHALVRAIDRALYDTVIAAGGTIWLNSTAYPVGAIVISPQDGTFWSCAVAHTSVATPTTFSADRVANPTYWNTLSGSAASSITFTPAGAIVATNVQTAIEELDAEKADATATTAALAFKAPIASPTFTGTPAAPTAAPGTNTTQIATTGFVKAAVDVVLGGVSAAFDTLSEIATAISGAPLSKVDDSNVTLTLSGGHALALLSATTITVGWTGDLPFSRLAQGSALSVLGVAANGIADVASIAAANDGEVLRRSGTTLGFGTIATAGIANDAVTYDKMQNVTVTARFIGRITAGAGNPEELTGTQATTLLDVFTNTLKGLVPASGGGTTNFLRADGSWAAAGGSGTAASQAEQEAGSSTTVFTSPGRQHFHPSALKAWVKFNTAGTKAGEYNITSVTDNGAGDWSVNIATDFADTNYVASGMCGAISISSAISLHIAAAADPTAGVFRVTAQDPFAGGAADPADPAMIMLMFAGDLP